MIRLRARVLPLVLGLVALLGWAGCRSTPTSPGAPPVAKATLSVLNLHTTGSYDDFDGSCQTSGIIEFRAWDPSGPSGRGSEPVELEWSFQVDRGRGWEPSPDWGDGRHVWVDAEVGKPIEERTLALPMLTIGQHQATLTVRTRDGARASTTLDVLVTSCEECGI